MKKIIFILLSTLTAIAGALWLGLKVKPKPFASRPEQTPELDAVELPANLPPPVVKFYEVIMGDRLPVIESAILTGRAELRFGGITFPARWRFTHVAGQDYRHYIEATIFGYPILKVNEWYLDGHSRLELPFGVVENEPKVDMAANLGLWAESLWLPSIYLTDHRVRWQAVDETTARLIVPFGKDEDSFTVTFDSETGLIVTMEAMRYKDATAEEKTLWINKALVWESFHGTLIPALATVTWQDEGTPWLIATLEEVVYNADLSEYVRASGP